MEMNLIEKRVSSKRKTKFLLWCITFLIQVAAIPFLHTVINCDSLNPLALAFKVRGDDWSRYLVADGYYYKYGQLLLQLPFILLIRDSVFLYRVLLAVNAVVVSFIPVCAYEILTRYFCCKNDWISVLLSLAAGLLPCVTLNSKYTWAESFLLVIPWAFLLVLLNSMEEKEGRKRKWLNSVGLAVLQVYAYMVHSRGIIILIAAFLSVCFVRFVYKNKNILFSVYLASTVLMLGLDRLLTNVIKAQLYPGAELIGESLNILSVDFLGRLFSRDGMGVFLQEIFGWTFASVISTFGLAAVGIVAAVAMLMQFKNEEYTKQERVVCRFALLFFLGALAVGTLFFFNDLYGYVGKAITKRGDKLIYTRYTDPAAVMLSFAGLYALLIKGSFKQKMNRLAAAGLFTIPFLVYLGVIAGRVSDTITWAHGNMTLNYFVDMSSCVHGGMFEKVAGGMATGIACFALLSFLLFLWLMGNRQRVKYVLAVCLGVSLICYGRSTYNALVRQDSFQYDLMEKVGGVLEDIDDPALKNIYTADEILRCGLQYHFYDYYVLSDRDDNRMNMQDMFMLGQDGAYSAELYDDDFYTIEGVDTSYEDYFLYVKGDRLNAALNEAGYETRKLDAQLVWPNNVSKTANTVANLSKELDGREDNSLEVIYALDSAVYDKKSSFTSEKHTVGYIDDWRSDYAAIARTADNSLFVSSKDENLDSVFEEFYEVEVNAPEGTYIWGRGEELRSALEELGFWCGQGHTTVRTYLGRKLSVGPDEKETDGDALLVEPGNTQLGPYVFLEPGKYQIDIYGKNLSDAEYVAYYGIGRNMLEIASFKAKDTHVQYLVDVPECANFAEFLCDNWTDQTVRIDSLIISQLYPESQTSVKEGASTIVGHRSYKISDMYRNFLYHLECDENCVPNLKNVCIYPQGQMSVNNIRLEQGTNRIILRGSNIQLADVSIRSGDGTLTAVEGERGVDSITYDAENMDAVDICIHNAAEEDITFTNMDIYWLGFDG